MKSIYKLIVKVTGNETAALSFYNIMIDPRIQINIGANDPKLGDKLNMTRLALHLGHYGKSLQEVRGRKD